MKSNKNQITLKEVVSQKLTNLISIIDQKWDKPPNRSFFFKTTLICPYKITPKTTSLSWDKLTRFVKGKISSVLSKMLAVRLIKRRIPRYTTHKTPYLNLKILAVFRAKMGWIKWYRMAFLLTLCIDMTTIRYLWVKIWLFWKFKTEIIALQRVLLALSVL